MSLGTVALVLSVSGCAARTSSSPRPSPQPSASTAALRHVFGALDGDKISGCVWITPGEPGGPTSPPVELRLPADVTIAFTPRVQITTGNHVLRAGQLVLVEILGSTAGRAGCPLPDDHSVIDTGTPGPWRGIVQVTGSPTKK